MSVGERRDLGQMRNAEYLLGARKLLQLLADGFGGTASDAGIDFVEDQRALSRSALRAVGTGSVASTSLDRRLQRQHDARQLPAGGDFFYWPERLARIRRNQVLHLVKPFSAPAPFLV